MKVRERKFIHFSNKEINNACNNSDHFRNLRESEQKDAVPLGRHMNVR